VIIVTIPISDIKTAQLALAGVGIVFEQQGTSAVTAANGAPSSSSDGVSTITSKNENAIVSEIAVILGSDVTSVDITIWGLKDLAGTKTWTALGQAVYTGIDKNWSEILPSRSNERLYIEVTSVDGTEGVTLWVGPADPDLNG
jgi:hypothetical protein